MRGGKRGACGRAVHGIPSPDGSANLCNACRRPGSSDHLNTGWQHIGAGEYWELLTEWATAAAGAWPHHRDLIEEPLQPKECICSRQDCVRGLYLAFVRKHRGSGGSAAVMQTGQKSPGGRYPSLTHQVIRDKDAFQVSEMDVSLIIRHSLACGLSK